MAPQVWSIVGSSIGGFQPPIEIDAAEAPQRRSIVESEFLIRSQRRLAVNLRENRLRLRIARQRDCRTRYSLQP